MPEICLDYKSSFPQDFSNGVTKQAEITPIESVRAGGIQKIDIPEIINYVSTANVEAFKAEVLPKLNANQKYIDVMACAIDAQLKQTEKELETLQKKLSKL